MRNLVMNRSWPLQWVILSDLSPAQEAMMPRLKVDIYISKKMQKKATIVPWSFRYSYFGSLESLKTSYTIKSQHPKKKTRHRKCKICAFASFIIKILHLQSKASSIDRSLSESRTLCFFKLSFSNYATSEYKF